MAFFVKSLESDYVTGRESALYRGKLHVRYERRKRMHVFYEPKKRNDIRTQRVKDLLRDNVRSERVGCAKNPLGKLFKLFSLFRPVKRVQKIDAARADLVFFTVDLDPVSGVIRNDVVKAFSTGFPPFSNASEYAARRPGSPRSVCRRAYPGI